MKLITPFFLAAIVAISISSAVRAEDTNAAPDDAQAKYTKVIEGRTADILKELDIKNADTQTRVHDIIIAQYRALNTWHTENDAKLKASKSDTNATANIHASLKAIHNDFLAKLAQ